MSKGIARLAHACSWLLVALVLAVVVVIDVIHDASGLPSQSLSCEIIAYSQGAGKFRVANAVNRH